MRHIILVISLLIISFQSFGHEFIIGINERDIYRYKDESGAWIGKDIELTKAVFKRTPYSFKFVSLPWKRVLKGLEAGTIDMTLAAIDSAERHEYALFSKQIFRFSHYMLFVHKSKLDLFQSIEKLADLANTNILVGALRGAIYSESYNELMNQKEFRERLAFIDKDQKLPTFVLKGRVDAYIDSEIEGKHYLLKNSQYSANIVPFFRITTDKEAESQIMFSKKTMTQIQVNVFDQALKELHESGEYKQISKMFN